jgi:P27 family predicted phage terminase small subunit
MRAESIVITTDTGVTKVNPALTAMMTLGTQLRNSCREFGLTPSSEQSLGSTAKRDSGSDPYAQDAAAQA